VHVFKQTNTFATELVKVCSRKRRRIHAQYHPNLERHAQVFHMTPGTTLYIPRLQPHWVANGDAICVSLSLNFFTPSDMRRELLYTANELFRNLMERVPRPTLARRVPAP
jgi:ribosomal protein L16 Arg81 hydroxylase